MTTRAQKLIDSTNYKGQMAICALIEFAAQNPRLELGNYGFDANGRRAYAQESRSITADWKRFKSALWDAMANGVTDADVIAEAPHAFSGRLTPMFQCVLWSSQTFPLKALKDQTYTIDIGKGATQDFFDATGKVLIAWDYTPGQYMPTEYRKAAAALLEYATRRVRQARPPEKRTVSTIAELKALNQKNGGCWFEPSSMRFFGTRIESKIIQGRYFITSEQPPHGSRKYTVRSFDDEGSVDTVGEFCTYSDKETALIALRVAASNVERTEAA